MAEELIKVGDEVLIITADGVRHEFETTAITNEQVVGDEVSVAINDIVALETREFSGGKTAALAGGAILLYQILAAVAVAATLGL